MPLLDALLAFALTMLALATLVTVIVQIVHDLLRVRARGLRRMMGRFCKREMPAILERLAPEASLGGAIDAAAMSASLTRSAAVSDRAEQLASSPRGAFLTTPSLTYMTAEEFVQRLHATDLGKEIETKLAARAEEIYQALAREYDSAVTAASELFARKARWWSIVIGFALAFAANVDGIRLLETYVADEGTRQAMLASQDNLLDFAEARLDAAASGDDEGAAVEIATIGKEIESAREELKNLQKTGLPIGWTENRKPESGVAWWRWFMGVCMTGLLLGLGAPFWYDAVRAVAQVAQALGRPRTARGPNPGG